MNRLGVILFYTHLCSAFCLKLPDNFKRCRRDDPDLGNCIGKNTEDALVKMRNGLPTFGIGPLEPLEINEMKIKTPEGPITFEQTFNDVKVYGLSNAKTKNNKFDWKTLSLYSELYFPRVEVDAHYKIKGKLLLLTMKGDGASNLTFVDTYANVTIDLDPFEKNGKEYWKVKDFKFKFDPKSAIINYEDIYKGNKELSDSINKVLNQEWRLFYDEIGYVYDNTLSLLFKNIANQIFTKVPVEDILIQ